VQSKDCISASRRKINASEYAMKEKRGRERERERERERDAPKRGGSGEIAACRRYS